MRCFNEYLSSNIGGCPSVAGVDGNSHLIPRSGVTIISMDNGEVTFDVKVGTNIIPVYVPGDLPYSPTVEGTKNEMGLQKFNKTVSFLFLENTSLSQVQIYQLQNDGYILVMTDKNDRNPIFGIERGLQFVSSSQEFSSTDTHGGIMVEMSEMYANTAMLFNTTWDLPRNTMKLNVEGTAGEIDFFSGQIFVSNNGDEPVEIQPNTPFAINSSSLYVTTNDLSVLMAGIFDGWDIVGHVRSNFTNLTLSETKITSFETRNSGLEGIDLSSNLLTVAGIDMFARSLAALPTRTEDAVINISGAGNAIPSAEAIAIFTALVNDTPPTWSITYNTL